MQNIATLSGLRSWSSRALTLRLLYTIDGWVMITVGIMFWRWINLLAWFFGIDTSPEFIEDRDLWNAISFGGPFGGALMAFGLASLAVARSKDPEFQRTAAVYFFIGHVVLAFVVFAKQMAFWRTTAGFVLLDITTLPCAAFYYYLVVGAGSSKVTGLGPEREQHIREVAGQEERNRLAQDLHDSVKQRIFSIHTNLATAQARWESDGSGARDAIDHARESARDAMTEMSALLDRLRRDPIESVGLVEALRRQAEALGFECGAEVITKFGEMPAGDRIRPGAMTTTFRIAQEAMANIARHARPSHVWLEVGTNGGVHPAQRELVLKIRDDGQGFDIASAASGMGLANMRARANEIGARLGIESVIGGGTVMNLRVPLLDPKGQRVRHHVVSLFAALVPTMVSFLLILFPWPEWRQNMAGLTLLGWVITLYHASALVRLRWR